MPRSGNTTARGYGSTHQTERKRYQPIVEAGFAHCARCGQWIQPGTPWDLGHTPDRRAYTGPEHRYCNRADGARRRNNGHRRDTTTTNASRNW